MKDGLRPYIISVYGLKEMSEQLESKTLAERKNAIVAKMLEIRRKNYRKFLFIKDELIQKSAEGKLIPLNELDKETLHDLRNCINLPYAILSEIYGISKKSITYIFTKNEVSGKGITSGYDCFVEYGHREIDMQTFVEYLTKT